MLRKEAENLIDKNVYCWTALWGSYAGEVVEIYGSPWRARVKILEVVSYPVQGIGAYVREFFARKPFEYGTIKDFGGANIKPLDENETIKDYSTSSLIALRNEIDLLNGVIEFSKRCNKPYGIETKALEILKERLLQTSRNVIIDQYAGQADAISY
jgi:hypothetical protein